MRRRAVPVNWIMALLALLLWSGAFGWYFYPELRGVLHRLLKRPR